MDESVRNALIPHLASPSVNTGHYAVAAGLQRDATASNSSIDGRAAMSAGAESGDLDTIQSFLLRGDKREAVRYALDHKLWAHALVIAAGVDKDLQSSVTREFIQAELAALPGSLGGREPLKVAYSLLSGAGATSSEFCFGQDCYWFLALMHFSSVEEFIPPRSLLAQTGPVQSFTSLAAAMPYAPASRSPTPVSADYPSDIAPEVLSQWRQTAAMVVANRTSGDMQVLLSLGDVLSSNGWLKAAHAW